MNICVLSGNLVRNAAVNGVENRVLKFLLATSYRRSDDAKQGTAYVPCVLFEPTPEIEELLAKKKGAWVECAGRVTRFVFEADGARRFSTEVVIDPNSLRVVTKGDMG